MNVFFFLTEIYDTVDGSEIRGSPGEGQVVYLPLFSRFGLYLRWFFSGLLNHQQYIPVHLQPIHPKKAGVHFDRQIRVVFFSMIR